MSTDYLNHLLKCAVKESREIGQWLERKEGHSWLVYFKVDKIAGYLYIEGKIH